LCAVCAALLHKLKGYLLKDLSGASLKERIENAMTQVDRERKVKHTGAGINNLGVRGSAAASTTCIGILCACLALLSLACQQVSSSLLCAAWHQVLADEGYLKFLLKQFETLQR
jgi:hypothetical protein